MAALIAAPLAVDGSAVSAPSAAQPATMPATQPATPLVSLVSLVSPVSTQTPVASTVDTRDAATPANAAQTTQTTPATTTQAVPAKPGWPMAMQAAPGAPAAPASSPATAGSIGGAVLALFLVIGLILLLAWVAKRLPGVGGATNAALRVVGTLSLGPRERVVVVTVGDTQLLLGTGSGGTRVLHELHAPLPVAAQKPQTMPTAFAQVLAQHFGKKTS